MNIPANLKYASSHEWVRLEGGLAEIGITDFAQAQLGDVTFVELPRVGDALKAGQSMGSIESVKAASDLYCPVSGEVAAVNTALETSPELVNNEPYESGWMIKVKFTDVPANLLSAEDYAKIVH